MAVESDTKAQQALCGSRSAPLRCFGRLWGEKSVDSVLESVLEWKPVLADHLTCSIIRRVVIQRVDTRANYGMCVCAMRAQCRHIHACVRCGMRAQEARPQPEADYVKLLTQHHAVMVAAMKTKQSSEMGPVDALDKALARQQQDRRRRRR